ncbi:MAG: hypothetical protein OXC59_07135 [Acidimicrobiaceae bacterium]|nr:hypothetical protein [Acidimicrobiaceae bacterium]
MRVLVGLVTSRKAIRARRHGKVAGSSNTALSTSAKADDLVLLCERRFS